MYILIIKHLRSEITNKRDTPILINDPNIDSTMYIEDKNATHYQAYTHEAC